MSKTPATVPSKVPTKVPSKAPIIVPSKAPIPKAACKATNMIVLTQSEYEAFVQATCSHNYDLLLARTSANEARLERDVAVANLHSLTEANKSLTEENKSLKLEVADLNRRLAAQSLGSPDPRVAGAMFTSVMSSPSVSTGNSAIKAISSGERLFICNTVQSLFESKIMSKEAAIKNIIHKMNVKWAGLTSQDVQRFAREAREGIERNNKRQRDGQLDADRQIKDQLVGDILKPLGNWTAIFSIQHATEVVACYWPSDMGPSPCRSFVYAAMKRLGYAHIPTEQENLDSAEVSARTEIFRLEYAYLVDQHKIHPSLILNIDESAVRMVPTAQYTWVMKGQRASKDILKAFPLRRNYTTLTACVSQAGDKLPLMINWKGTDRLRIPGFENIIQYCQPKTHWNTTESFIFFVRTVLLPYCEAAYAKLDPQEQLTHSKKFLLLFDCAPIHVSLNTRMRLNELIADKGFVIFLPAGCTSTTQPLDIGCFGSFKQCARATHLRYLSEQLENRSADERLRNLASTTETRALCLMALEFAWQHLSSREVSGAFEVSLGRSRVRKPTDGPGERYISIRGIGTEREWLESLASRARARVAADSAARARRLAVVKEAHEKKKSVPRDATVHHMTFRFGLPHDEVVDDSELLREALRFDEVHARHEPKTTVAVEDPDEDDNEEIFENELQAECSEDDIDGEVSAVLRRHAASNINTPTRTLRM